MPSGVTPHVTPAYRRMNDFPQALMRNDSPRGMEILRGTNALTTVGMVRTGKKKKEPAEVLRFQSLPVVDISHKVRTLHTACIELC